MPRAEAAEILAAARTWLGTPWRHQGRLRGVAVDCAGLVVGVGKELGLLAFDTRAYGRLPDGQRLRALCDEHLAPKPVVRIAPGDVLLLRFTRHSQHLAIAGDRGQPFSLIHAYAEAGACVEHGADARWFRRLVAAYAYPQPGA